MKSLPTKTLWYFIHELDPWCEDCNYSHNYEQREILQDSNCAILKQNCDDSRDWWLLSARAATLTWVEILWHLSCPTHPSPYCCCQESLKPGFRQRLQQSQKCLRSLKLHVKNQEGPHTLAIETNVAATKLHNVARTRKPIIMLMPLWEHERNYSYLISFHFSPYKQKKSILLAMFSRIIFALVKQIIIWSIFLSNVHQKMEEESIAWFWLIVEYSGLIDATGTPGLTPHMVLHPWLCITEKKRGQSHPNWLLFVWSMLWLDLSLLLNRFVFFINANYWLWDLKL